MCCELSLPLDLFPTLASWYHVIGLKLEAAPERVYIAVCVIMTELSHLSARLLTHIQISSEPRDHIHEEDHVSSLYNSERKIKTDSNELLLVYRLL